MAVSVFKTFAPNEVLTASDLNSSFLQFAVNGQDVGDPRTKDVNMVGFTLKLDSDGNTSIRASTNDQIDVQIAGVDRARISAAGVFFDGVKLNSQHEVIRQIESRTVSSALEIGAMENQAPLAAVFFSPGGM